MTEQAKHTARFDFASARAVRDPSAPSRPFVAVDQFGREWVKPKRGGGYMARHFRTEETLRAAIAKAEGRS